MLWRKLVWASFFALLVGALITAEPTRLVRHSGGCVGIQQGPQQQQQQQGQPSTSIQSHTNISSSNTSGANGVIVDAEGVLRKQVFPDPTGQLTRDRMMAARGHLDRRVAKASKLRKVSLNRLEAVVKAHRDKQLPLSDEMMHLAGLTRVRYVFYYPDTKDVVLAGPAEAWGADLSGRVCGVESGQATLDLEDLVVALRAFPPSGKKTSVILCSIDPTAEGLAKMQAFLHSIGRVLPPDDDGTFTESIVEGLRTSLGFQNIRVEGVQANTHFAQVLIEADYRMKLIGLGMEAPAVKMASFVDRAHPTSTNRNALQRWYFVPDYKCVRVAADSLGMELVGVGVKLIDQDEIVAADGGRKATGKSNKASKAFVNAFTQKYADIAARTPVYAQLRNCIDLAVAAAFIQQQDYYAKAGWQLHTFADETALPVATLNVPSRVETVVAAVFKDNALMTPIGGGVQMQPVRALESKNLLADEDGKISELRESVGVKDLPADQWWWD